jgi:hypothetical protein
MSANCWHWRNCWRSRRGCCSAQSAEDWETLASHEAERRALAESLPADLTADLAPALQARARVLIENCLRCDQNLQPLVAVRLNELRVVLRAAGQPLNR